MSIRVLEACEIRELFSIDDLTILEDLAHPRHDAEGRLARKLNGPDFGLEDVGGGSYAAVVAHPTRDDLVIRVSRREDGWVGYAAGPANVLRPEMHALGWTGQVWVAIAERLMPVSEHEECDVTDRVDLLLNRTEDDPLAAAAHDLLLDADARDLRFDDVEPRNVMMRPNGDLVINDPMTEMTDEMEAELRERFALATLDDEDMMRGWF